MSDDDFEEPEEIDYFENKRPDRTYISTTLSDQELISSNELM